MLIGRDTCAFRIANAFHIKTLLAKVGFVCDRGSVPRSSWPNLGTGRIPGSSTTRQRVCRVRDDIIHQHRNGDVDRIASRFVQVCTTHWLAVSPLSKVMFVFAIRGMLYLMNGFQIIESKIQMVVECVASCDAPQAQTRTIL